MDPGDCSSENIHRDYCTGSPLGSLRCLRMDNNNLETATPKAVGAHPAKWTLGPKKPVTE